LPTLVPVFELVDRLASDLRHDQSAGVDADERQLQGLVPLPAKR
jgi:hypothetical protein